MTELPSNCPICGVPLVGGATRHATTCPWYPLTVYGMTRPVPSDLYPYTRILLHCGCQDIVTGPGAVDVLVCPAHLHDDSALMAARLDAFSRDHSVSIEREREACAQCAESYEYDNYGAISAGIAAAIRARGAKNATDQATHT